MDNLTKEDVKQLLNRCWMTHDGMWFMNVLGEVGIETTNKLNKGAIRSMAGLEVKRLQKALGIPEVNNIDQLKDFCEGAIGLLVGDYMDFNWSWAGEANAMRVDVYKCFAHNGIARMGVIDKYECGIFDRICSWFHNLNVKFQVTPDIPGCMMHTDGQCHREFVFTFKE